MTPEERSLVADLFKRLAELEGSPRDPEAERLIREGQQRAPNAVYALVQTVLLQDEALRTANDHIAALQDELAQARQARDAQQPQAGKWNTGGVLRGSVPSVGRADQPMGVPAAYDRDRGYADTQRDPPPQGGYGGPFGGEPARGGGFLGTAAAVAAGAIGGGLLLSGIRSALGSQSQGSSPFSDAFNRLTGGSKSEAGKAESDELSRAAGLDDIDRGGSNPFGAADLKGENFDDSDFADDTLDDEEDFSDDAFDDDDV